MSINEAETYVACYSYRGDGQMTGAARYRLRANGISDARRRARQRTPSLPPGWHLRSVIVATPVDRQPFIR